jgi:predicted TIM-barrel fold metal-dependent hydrolase
LGTDNSRMLAAIAQQPHALRGVAVVAPNVTVPELQALHAGGVRGVRLNLSGVRDDESAMRDIPSRWWSALIEANLHLELHTDVGRVATLLPNVPRDIVVVLDHFAKPESVSGNDTTVAAVRDRNALGHATYVTLSGAYRQSLSNTSRCAEIAALWRGEVGIERLLWGSDWPCTNHEHAANYAALFDALSAWLPGTNDRYVALSENANSIYWR